MGYAGGKNSFQTGQDMPSSNKVTLGKNGSNYPYGASTQNPKIEEHPFCGSTGRGPTGREESSSDSLMSDKD